MAPQSGTLRVGRYFLALLALIAVLYSLVFFTGNRNTPKLGIDLVGGIRVIYTAQGNTTGTQMDVARQLIEERVNGNGVTGATVQVQGGNQILVLIPNGTEQDVRDLGAAAKLNFRGVVSPAIPVTCNIKTAASSTASGSASASGTTASPSATGSPAATPSTSSSAPADKPAATSSQKTANDAAHRPLTAPTPAKTPAATPTAAATPTTAATAKSGAAASGSATPTAAASSSAAPKPGKCTSDPFKAVLAANKGLTIPTVDTDFDKLTQAQQTALVAGVAGPNGTQVGGLTNYDCNAAQSEPDINSKYYVVCGDQINSSAPDQQYAFLLGKVIVPGTQIDDASAQAPNTANGGSSEWTVALNLKSSGSSAWGKYTTAHNVGGESNASGADVTSCSATTIPCAKFVAFTLNGQVISAPVNISPINGGTTQISGNFGQDSSKAKALADKLQFGSLPLTFKLDDSTAVSATLGTSQLHAALLAGGIGLVLVVLYSLIYYRALGVVTIASLIVSAVLVYASLVILGIHMGFTLDLAGVTGFIVALGITADSFVVFFERIKDEVHEGRSVRVAVPRAWVRARRTILSADTVSFLAAAILYFVASADVQGFAFTLGLSTVLDLVVVFLFTHPIVSLLSRSKAFGSARFTGLNSVRAGGVVVSDAPVRRSERRASGSAASQASSVDVLDDVEESDDDAAPVTDAEPRTRTAPRGGTAAERAAARRARLRGETEDDAKGES